MATGQGNARSGDEMIREQILADGFLSLEMGVDGGRSPSLLPDTQVWEAKNCSFRGGYAKCRPKAKQLSYSYGTDALDAVDTGKFQGAGAYVDSNGNGWVYLSISGRIWRLDISEPGGTLEEANPAVVNSSTRDKAWFCQADRFLLIQDGQGPCSVLNGPDFTSIPSSQIPVGTVMAYGLGRIWIASGREYVGGDLIYSDPDKQDESILWFTENDFLNEGGKFSVPQTCGDITGLSFTAKQDAASGEGSLMVFTRNGIFEFDAPVDRTVWKDLEQPLQRFSLLNFGATSNESISVVNGDLFFRSEDGIRSFYFARRDFGSWGNTPVSREVGGIIDSDQQAWLDSASSVLFDNRILMTAEPRRDDRGTVHSKLVALDFNLVSSMRGKSQPAWEGSWEFEAIEILQILSVDESTGRRCIIIGMDKDSGQIQLWELAREADEDQPVETVAWEFTTKSFQFGNPMSKKRLLHGELWLDNVNGALDVDSFYKANNSGCWVGWSRYSTTIAGCVSTPEVLTCTPPEFPQASGKSRVGFPQAPDSVDAVNCEPKRDGYEFQIRLKFNADAVVKRFRVTAKELDEPVSPKISSTCTVLTEPCLTC